MAEVVGQWTGREMKALRLPHLPDDRQEPMNLAVSPLAVPMIDDVIRLTSALLDSVVAQARTWGCTRLWQVISDFKGPGKDRAVYEF